MNLKRGLLLSGKHVYNLDCLKMKLGNYSRSKKEQIKGQFVIVHKGSTYHTIR